MTPLKLLAAASLFAIAMAAQPAFAVNEGAPTSPSVNQSQAAPRPTLSPEERKAKRQHRREMRRKRQLERQSAPPQPDRI